MRIESYIISSEVGNTAKAVEKVPHQSRIGFESPFALLFRDVRLESRSPGGVY